MKRMKFAPALALMLALLCCVPASATQYDGFSYVAHYVTCDAGAMQGWNAQEYAETDGVLMTLYADTADATVSLAAISDAPTLDDLLDARLADVSSYATLVSDVVRDDWYAPWLESEPGLRARYSYAYAAGEGGTEGADSAYHVTLYAAPLDEEYRVVVQLTDWSDDPDATASNLEAGLLESFGIGSFEVDGSMSAYLTGASGADGQLLLALQPFDVVISEDQLEYDIQTTGEVQSVPMSEDARLLLPNDSELLQDVPLTVDGVTAYIDGYHDRHDGHDFVVNVLMSGGKARWVTYSYLY